MAQVPKTGELEVGHDLAFQRREWTIQRVGWGVIGLVIVAALAGMTGSGPLSRANAGSERDPLRVQFSRFDRIGAPTAIHVEIEGGAVPGEQVAVWLDNAYLDTVQIEQISPEPDSVVVGTDRMTHIFSVEEPGQPMEVMFNLRPERFGWRTGKVGLSGGPSLEFRQLVYP